MFDEQTLLISAAVLLMAMLYSTVGHGGGSGYLAIFAVTGIVPEQMRPTALLLNVIVASIATWKFGKTNTCSRNIFIPLVLASVPAAFIGGYVEISSAVYKPAVGLILLYAAARLFIPIKSNELSKRPAAWVIMITGVVVGFSSGIIGVGGGIFLSPIVLLLGWATAKQTAAMSAPFILVNSIAGLLGIMADRGSLPVDSLFVLPLGIAVVIGGMLGASFGSSRLGHQGLRTVLGVVLLFASIKMFLTMTHQQNTPPPVDVKSIL